MKPSSTAPDSEDGIVWGRHDWREHAVFFGYEVGADGRPAWTRLHVAPLYGTGDEGLPLSTTRLRIPFAGLEVRVRAQLFSQAETDASDGETEWELAEAGQRWKERQAAISAPRAGKVSLLLPEVARVRREAIEAGRRDPTAAVVEWAQHRAEALGLPPPERRTVQRWIRRAREKGFMVEPTPAPAAPPEVLRPLPDLDPVNRIDRRIAAERERVRRRSSRKG